MQRFREVVPTSYDSAVGNHYGTNGNFIALQGFPSFRKSLFHVFFVFRHGFWFFYKGSACALKDQINGRKFSLQTFLP
jgi:hypothetical protein